MEGNAYVLDILHLSAHYEAISKCCEEQYPYFISWPALSMLSLKLKLLVGLARFPIAQLYVDWWTALHNHCLAIRRAKDATAFTPYQIFFRLTRIGDNPGMHCSKSM